MTRFLQKESTQQLFESITILNSGIAELVNSLIQSTNNVSAVLEHSSLPSPPSLPVISDIGPISTLSIPAELSLLRNQKKELEEIEARLPVLEQEIQELDVQLSDTSDYAQLKVLSERREAAECELESKTERWMELSEKQS